MDHLRPDGRTLDIAISRIKADPAKRRGILLSNPGGPGGPGLAYPLDLKPLLGEVASQYDLIGVDARFMGRSDPLDCGPVRLADLYRSSITRRDFITGSRHAAAFAAACRANNSGLLQHANIREAARDLDAIRAALGEDKLSYYGVSWGADLGVVYSQLFSANVDRMVVDSVTDVEGSEYRHLATGLGAEAAFDEWAAWAAWRNDKYHLGRTGMQVRANVTELVYRRTPVKVGKYRIDSAAMPWVLQSALGDESDRDLMARNVRTLLDAAAGKPIKPSEELLGFLGQFFEISPDLSRFAAASLSYTCNDNGWPSGPAQYWRDARRDHKTQPLFAVTILPCAYWTDHTTEPDLAIGNNTRLLIVQADRDSIPVAWARKLHQKLPNSILKTVDRRAHGVYDERIPEMVAEVNRYLAG
ncbi:alpha/beta fold hydrolase [Kribbella sp. CA-294648]|uniref:alpha/beta fold hydrolase n=1 Tax=Kribbella sp. CA-294648 TaxID=3239948 RepID=UPI003D8D88DD